MPPGLALFSVSQKGLERASKTAGRGYYFDFIEFQKNQAEDMTPSTPSISHIYALESKLEDIFNEGIMNRHARHAATNSLVHDWVRSNGFEFFAPEGYRSKSLTCVANNRGVDVAAMLVKLKEQGFIIDGGYGKLKGKTFRISNMGDETVESVGEVLAAIDRSM
jgi:aspartate aminotransferase-like enzyme